MAGDIIIKGARNNMAIVLRSEYKNVCIYPFNKKIVKNSIESIQKLISPIFCNFALVKKQS